MKNLEQQCGIINHFFLRMSSSLGLATFLFFPLYADIVEVAVTIDVLIVFVMLK